MKWKKEVQRENDFLKNYLLYESFVDNFLKKWNFPHPEYLTVRKGQSYTHHFNTESYSALAQFVFEQSQKDPEFINILVEDGKKHFDNLINFAENLPPLKNKTDSQILELIKEYFHLYKEPYPYFLLTVDAELFEKQNTEEAKAIVEKLGRLRLYGRSSFNKTHELAAPLFEEIANRPALSITELKFFTPQEIISLLENKERIKRTIQERDNCFLVYDGNKFELHENASLIIHDPEGFNGEIKGQTTFPGIYQGKVKIIKVVNDLQKINGGEVLVLQMTTTDLIGINLQKAGAIVTDEGGITCHAAILSREWKIPCVIGTKIATKILKDDDLVEVDANIGVVKKL